MFIPHRSRRLAFVAAAIIGLAACGSASQTTSSSEAGSIASPTTTPQPAVIHVPGGAGQATGQATGQPASDDAATSPESSKMTMAANFNYVYDGDIVDLTAPAASWFFAPGVTPTTDSVLQVARAFGIEGEVREISADMGGGWIVGSDDFSEPSVTVGADATLSWWYNPGNGGQDASVSCVVADAAPPFVGADGSTADAAGAAGAAGAAEPSSPPADGDGEALTTVVADPLCAEPDPPANVPSAGEAESKAADLLAALGVQSTDYEFETYADAWGANVTAYLRLDGIRTPMSINVGFGAEGAIAWAGGFLATAERGADYPRIGIEASVQRLNDQSTGWMYAATSTARAETATADLTAEATADASSDIGTIGTIATGAATNAAPDRSTDKDEPVSPTETVTPPEFESITLTLTNAQPSLEMLWAADNTVWLLPGYKFDSTDGGVFGVIAVEDQYIDIADTPVGVPEPLPLETAPMPTEPAAIDPTPSNPIETIEPIETECLDIAPATGNAPSDPAAPAMPVEPDDGSQWIGLCIADATKLAESMGYQMRVVQIDGVDQPVTMDYNEGRFNVAVDNGIVQAIVSIG